MRHQRESKPASTMSLDQLSAYSRLDAFRHRSGARPGRLSPRHNGKAPRGCNAGDVPRLTAKYSTASHYEYREAFSTAGGLCYCKDTSRSFMTNAGISSAAGDMPGE